MWFCHGPWGEEKEERGKGIGWNYMYNIKKRVLGREQRAKTDLAGSGYE